MGNYESSIVYVCRVFRIVLAVFGNIDCQNLDE